MPIIGRRAALTLAGGALAGGALALPRIAIAAGEQRADIRIAVQLLATSTTLDPLAEQSNVQHRISNSYLERLIARNLQGKLESMPGLATSWRRLDATTVEVSLREGVRFHNGDVMTAEDVAFTFGPEHMFGATAPAGMEQTMSTTGARPLDSGKALPPQVPPVARRLWPSLVKVEIVDKLTVRFINATPDLTLEGRLSQLGSEIINRRAFEQAKTWLEHARAPVGTGPYRVRSYTPNRELVLEAFDEYWGGRPPLRTIRFLEIPEVPERVNGLRAGDFQFACDLPPDQIRTVESDPKLHVVGGMIPNHRISLFDKNGPLKDARVRQAMTHAIDRKQIVDSLWLGRTRIPPGLQWEFYDYMFVTGWTVPDYDPQKARGLLQAAGYKGDAIPYRLLNDYYTNQTATAQVLSEMWGQVGLNVQITMKENWAQVLDKAGTRGLHDWSNSAVFNDPVSSLVSQHGPQGQQQQAGMWTNVEMNQLAAQMVTDTDKERRHQTFARMLQIAERDDPAYTVLHQSAVFTGKLRSIGWKASPAFDMDFRAANWGDTVRG